MGDIVRGFTAGTLGLKIGPDAATGMAFGILVAAAGQPALAGATVALALLPYAAARIATRYEKAPPVPVAYLLATNRALDGLALLCTFHN